MVCLLRLLIQTIKCSRRILSYHTPKPLFIIMNQEVVAASKTPVIAKITREISHTPVPKKHGFRSSSETKILHCFFSGGDGMVLSLHRICPFISSTFASLIRFLSASLCCSCSSAICCAFDYCCGVLGLLGVAAAGNRCAGVDIMFL